VRAARDANATARSSWARISVTRSIFAGAMVRRPSLLLRFSRALTGLVTVWCLGCSSYEPLLSSLLGAKAGAMMNCDSDVTTPSDASDASVAPIGDHDGFTVSAATDQRGYDCGCGSSCRAPSPSFAAVAGAPSLVPAADHSEPSEPASVARAPLLPPPEFTT